MADGGGLLISCACALLTKAMVHMGLKVSRLERPTGGLFYLVNYNGLGGVGDRQIYVCGLNDICRGISFENNVKVKVKVGFSHNSTIHLNLAFLWTLFYWERRGKMALNVFATVFG